MYDDRFESYKALKDEVVSFSTISSDATRRTNVCAAPQAPEFWSEAVVTLLQKAKVIFVRLTSISMGQRCLVRLDGVRVMSIIQLTLVQYLCLKQ